MSYCKTGIFLNSFLSTSSLSLVVAGSAKSEMQKVKNSLHTFNHMNIVTVVTTFYP